MPVQLTARHTGEVAPFDGHHYVLRGDMEWLLFGARNEVEVAQTLEGLCEILPNQGLLLKFGNAVGVFDVPGVGLIEVVSGEWRRRDFDQMLAEVIDICSTLPFDEDGRTGDGANEQGITTRDDAVYHLFSYIRFALTNGPPPQRRLLPALHAILREPHRQFKRVRRTVPLGAVRHFDAASLTKVVVGARSLMAADAQRARGTVMSRQLHGFVPTQLDEYVNQETFDTPENRFIKDFLNTLDVITQRMRAMVRRSAIQTAFEQRVLRECANIENRLRDVRLHGLWRSIGFMDRVPSSSQVLQRRRGYREVYQHYVRMRLGARVPLPADMAKELLEARDVALLYELWCYFQMVTLLSNELGAPRKAAGAGTEGDDSKFHGMARDLSIEWPQGVRLLFSSSLTPTPSKRFSYSAALRPDIALEVQGRVHFFDAKFRVSSIDALLSQEIKRLSKGEGGTSIADTAWIIYPGPESKFFSRDGVRLELVGGHLPRGARGVGALSLSLHSAHRAALGALISRLLKAGR
jgi:hypothetical protein